MLRIFQKRLDQQSDQDLLQRYQTKDDLEALGVLFERYTDLVYGVCLKYFKNSTKAEDAVMSIFELLVRKAKVHEVKQFRGWLHVMARNYCLMELRKKEIIVSYDPQLMYSDEIVHPTFGEEENGVEKALKNCITKLPESQKVCINWFYFEDKSYKEIAVITKQEIGKVRSNIQNGRRNLKICLEKGKPIRKPSVGRSQSK